MLVRMSLTQYPLTLSRMHPRHALVLAAVLTCALAGCAAPARTMSGGDARLIIFGEQHDQVDQQRQVADAVRELASQGRLRAVVIEMADRGHDTASLVSVADDAQAREALGWIDKGWPWSQYGPVVMNALHAGVPVFGGNLPTAQVRATMADTALDARVDDGVRAKLADAVRDGHCRMLPEAQLPGMVRVQIARDAALAQTATEALAGAPPGQQVLLLTGAQHASRDRGVPWRLVTDQTMPATDIHVIAFGSNADLAVDEQRPASTTPREDPCEAFKRRLPPAPERDRAQ